MIDQFSKPHFRIYVLFPVVTHEKCQYTDGGGGVEALSSQLEESCEDRLRNVVGSSLALSAEEIRKEIEERLKVFVVRSPQWDGIAFVV